MKLIKAIALTSAIVSATNVMAADDALYELPTKAVVSICVGSELMDVEKETFDDFFSQAIPAVQEIKDEGGLVVANYLKDIRSGIILVFKDSADYTAEENADRLDAKIASILKERGIELSASSCTRYHTGGRMM